MEERVVAVRPTPGRARVIRAEHAAVVGRGLDDRVKAVRIGSGYGDPHLADDRIRHPGVASEIRPAVSAVRRLEDTAGAAGSPAPRWPMYIPDRRVHRVRVGGIHGKIRGTRQLAHEQDALPGRTSVSGAEDTALLVRPVGVAEHRSVDHVAVCWVDAHARNHCLARARC